jgi:hypothetical protein
MPSLTGYKIQCAALYDIDLIAALFYEKILREDTAFFAGLPYCKKHRMAIPPP